MVSTTLMGATENERSRGPQCCQRCLLSSPFAAMKMGGVDCVSCPESSVDVWLTIRVSTAPQFSFQVFLPTVSYPGKAQRGNMYIR
ncbi:uncharacterized protein YALI1_C31299g [Yarrowia lipolytica]|uniref:Uncharacterized protein n=1 Tax=Yarrowia lipolytica TaxID=4952 RepID=A0A1D8NCB6_YARLL|nr:hypothetical protein YALI1_C31299g [Yarrowia lipolytica]